MRGASLCRIRLHRRERYHDCAEETLECFAGVVDHFGIFAATYGIALRMFVSPHAQVVVIGEDAAADALEYAANERFLLGKAVVRLRQVAAQLLPPALAETIPNAPGVKEGRSSAILCSSFTCQPPIPDVEQLRQTINNL